MADDFSTYAGRQAYRDSHPGAIVDASGAYNPSTGQTTSGGGGGGTAQSGSSNTATPTSSGAAVYNTVNGPKTVDQMNAELRAVGWPGPPAGTEGAGSIANAYAQTTGGAVTETAGQNYGPAAQNQTQQQLQQPVMPNTANVPEANALLDRAQQVAYQAYLNARLNLDTDQLAFNKATQAFQNTISQAGVTGQFNGQPTLAAQEALGSINGQPTLAAQGQQQQTALGYLNLISGLKGPQDYGSYLRTIASTPNGIRDLVGAAAGKYVASSGATTGVQPTPASLGGLLNAAQTGSSGGTNFADYTNAAGGLPAPNQINPQNWNAMTTSQKQVLLGMYGQSGYDITDVQDLFKQSLPRYTSPSTPGTVAL